MGARTCVAWRRVLFVVNRNIHFSFIYGASYHFIHVRAREKRAVGGAKLGASGGTRCSHYNDNRKESAHTRARIHTLSLSHTQSHFLS